MDENARCGEIAILLDQLDELIEEAKPNFITGKLTVDKDEVLEIIREIRLKLPTELQQSLWIVEERNKILVEAQKEARLIVEEAEERVENMIDQHEITQYAKERAEDIIETARIDARQIHLGAVDYAEDVFKDTEKKLKKTLELIHNEVQEFESEITDVLRCVYDNRQEIKEMTNQINEQNS